MTSANVRGRYLRYSASATGTSYPPGLTNPRRPGDARAPRAPARARLSLLPSGPGEVHRVTPHEGLRQLYPVAGRSWASVSSSTEDSPRGLGRTLGKRVGLTTLTS